MKSAVKRIKGILLALMYVAINVIISFAIYMIYNLWYAASGSLSIMEIEKSANDNSFALTIIISIVSLWAYLLICKFRGKDISEYIKSKKLPKEVFLMSGLLALGGRLLVTVYYQLVQKIDIFEKSINNSAQNSPDINSMTEILIALFGILIVAPLFEEFLFRGLVMGELKKIMRPWAAIFFQAIIFGVVHGVLFQGVFAFFMGIVLGVLYHRTKNISTAVVCHAIFNYTATIMLWELTPIKMMICVIAGAFLMTFSFRKIFKNTTERMS